MLLITPICTFNQCPSQILIIQRELRTDLITRPHCSSLFSLFWEFALKGLKRKCFFHMCGNSFLGLEVWLKQQSACFAHMKQWVQTSAPPKKKKKKEAPFCPFFSIFLELAMTVEDQCSNCTAYIIRSPSLLHGGKMSWNDFDSCCMKSAGFQALLFF
jgi:hypothetical protein